MANDQLTGTARRNDTTPREASVRAGSGAAPGSAPGSRNDSTPFPTHSDFTHVGLSPEDDFSGESPRLHPTGVARPEPLPEERLLTRGTTP